ncbi:hypothetical protein A3C21_02645 [Candidatus Kaiserbacteria bacterium RIFCSPHIGHO2_02_FULL_59_21]|uniref:Aminotransferase class V n=2 Tax=Candidatus Kaiseribacteriota TaxID=1752734 RepID=A0A0G2BMT4_9BACT|nr:MAG: Aminotransferase class V [Candidatus Kaiserbacteria bacterium GW2011_GWA2_58_9]OGG62826.1 MAG: hypothetical protein A2766_01885 [Candidatus Kaiserbacteria bacterium RIFCSPHIGHO2_01_FULL_58_22]OGG67340.1 MAG: hypothetical protein A3C21_02645 [Candidatus Kaiserbacteria bacterium RIFCSPHIGHO2_02_FULL_59_21]OGG86291.1 MAG: hypothetical protein A3I47_03195 [Candidatus Kaiserbacteria bacterium RIFCSPLOWO2_02_FULL_59_19]
MWFSKRRIYLDYASAPPVVPEAIRAMREAEELIGNPGAIHAEGVAAKKSLEHSRARIAMLLGTQARELVFTSGLTEANNLAIIGYARTLERNAPRTVLGIPEGRPLVRGLESTHWVVSSIEHDAVLECFAEVERMGGTITHVEPDERGIITPDSVRKALRKETVFVSIGWANNEIGTIQPLAKIAHVIRSHEKERGTNIIFHTDAGQGPLYLPTLAHSLGVDLLSLGANKLYGPHGVGALYRNARAELAPILLGGTQERGLRAGTESVALAAGFAVAFETIVGERDAEAKRIKTVRDEFAGELLAQIPGLVVNSSPEHTLPHMLNVSIPNISSEYITLALDAKGIAVSTKSACREGEESTSHVVAALYPRPEDVWRTEHTLRFSLGRDTATGDIRRVVEALARVVAKAS